MFLHCFPQKCVFDIIKSLKYYNNKSQFKKNNYINIIYICLLKYLKTIYQIM